MEESWRARYALAHTCHKALPVPYIVLAVQVYETEDSFVIVMEECTGGTLFDRLVAKVGDQGGWRGCVGRWGHA